VTGPRSPRTPATRLTRRRALGLLGSGTLAMAGAALLGCGNEGGLTMLATPPPPLEVAPAPTVPPTPEPPKGPPPPITAGRATRLMLEGTPWQTPLVMTHSGQPGSRVLVLGGVHGNEPGGWAAAEAISDWEPKAGSLLVIPRANIVATRVYERTLPELGDLNRLYPGSTTAALPMARMAAAIVGVAREFEVDLVLDLHESWGFYLERGANGGTAFIGQTVAKGNGPLPNSYFSEAVAAVNTRISPREELTFRERIGQPNPSATPSVTPTPGVGGVLPGGAGTSSLSIGVHVPGATAVLIEMGQIAQAESRRSALHQALVTEILTRHGTL
jgi:Succinylglutamate desuccinylase / Aspartoacylase family